MYCWLIVNQSPLQNLLRWLLRRGSPLPIPNREVKSDCADGTAFTWESMSLPFFRKSFTKVRDFLFLVKSLWLLMVIGCGVGQMSCGVWQINCGHSKKSCGVRKMNCCLWQKSCGVGQKSCGVGQINCGHSKKSCGVWKMNCCLWQKSCGVWKTFCGVG